MKFCDKLSKLRKQNNITQEQLADKLGISRQAVSKWELGVSIPDMDKMLQLCNILNCTLDEILDDGVINDSKKANQRPTFTNYFQDFLKYITNIYNMFYSMTFKEKLKCLFEMTIVFLILLTLFLITFECIHDVFLDNFRLIPRIGDYLFFFLNNLIAIGIIVLDIIIFFHIFKIRYLDYYITIEDKNALEKSIEIPVESKKIVNKEYVEMPKKEKIIIRDPKHSSFLFFEFLSKIVLFMAKLLTAFIAFFFLIFFVFSLICFFFTIWHLNYGIIFLYISLGILGVIILTYLCIEVFYYFIIAKVENFKKIFILGMIGLVLIAFGTASTIIAGLDFKAVEKFNYKEDTLEIEMMDNLVFLDNYHYYGKVNYKIDDSINSIKIVTNHLENLDIYLYKTNDEGFLLSSLDYETDFFKTYKLVFNNLKNKYFINYNEDILFSKITIYLSSSNYQKLMSNKDKYETIDKLISEE